MKQSLIFVAVLMTLACQDDGPTSPGAQVVPNRPTPIPRLPAVWGVVVESGTDRPLIGARVEITDGPAAGTFALVTENGGIRGAAGYVIATLPSGTVTLRASATGYENQNKRAPVPIHCMVGPVLLEECGIDFYLRPSLSATAR